MIFAEDSLAGHRILVAGASSGLGRATAIAASKCGAQVAITGRNATRLNETLSLLKGEGHCAHEADLSDAEAATESISAIIAKHGTLNGAFYSAGTTLVLPAKLQKNRHLDDVFGAGLRGAFGLVRALLKKNAMHDGGSMVFMSSFSSVRGKQGMSAYCAAKAGLDGMVRALALEVAPRRIRVNSIVAGAVETEMHQSIVADINEEAVEDYRNRHPLGFGQPEDVANAAIFLLSDASRWITGSAMAVDGGAAA